MKKNKHKKKKNKEPRVMLHKDCHGGAKLAFTVGKVNVWGCAGASVDKVPQPLLAQISLSYDITSEYMKVNRLARKLFSRAFRHYNTVVDTPRMYIDWNDRGKPPVPFTFWKHLVADLRAATVESNLIINCAGGHGRTGTALVCIAHHAEIIPADTDAVVWLRSLYCPEAVESSSQLDYLRERGVYTEVKPEVIAYSSSYTWIQCTKCKFFASPQEAKDSMAVGGVVVCGHCSGTRLSKHKDYSMTSNRYCQVCNYSLTPGEEIHSTEIGVDICKPCEDKFGVEGAKTDSDRDVPPADTKWYNAY